MLRCCSCCCLCWNRGWQLERLSSCPSSVSLFVLLSRLWSPRRSPEWGSWTDCQKYFQTFRRLYLKAWSQTEAKIPSLWNNKEQLRKKIVWLSPESILASLTSRLVKSCSTANLIKRSTIVNFDTRVILHLGHFLVSMTRVFNYNRGRSARFH